MKLFSINKNYRNLTRLAKIISVIARYGFSAFLTRIKAGLGIVPERVFQIKQDALTIPLAKPERLRLAIEELGPAFIKMGQILSLRPDIIPPDYAAELEKLLDKTPPVPFKEIRATVEKDLGGKLEDIFESFDKDPVASGSIAQVHRAVLKEEKEMVAVKVLKPKTRTTVETDLSIMSQLVKLALHYIPELEQYRPTQLIQEFAQILHDEINFVKEARAIERFSRFFKNETDGFVYIPKVYNRYTERSVLVMEFIDGIKVTDFDALREAGMDLKVIAENGARIGLKEVFEFGFFHADPHPGNLFILPGNVVVPVDFGITGYIDEEGIQLIGNILIGILERDADRLIRYLKRYDFIEEGTNARKLKTDLYDVIQIVDGKKLSDIDMACSIQEFFSLMRKYRIGFPNEYFLILKTLLQIDGLGRKLYPDFNVTQTAKPYVREWVSRQYSPRKFMRDAYLLVDDMQYYLRVLTSEMGSLVKKFRYGKLRIPISHENLDKAVGEVDRTGNRISFAVIIAALLLSSSILVQAKVGPTIRGYPILGLAGFFTAAVMGVWLLVGIIKSGRL